MSDFESDWTPPDMKPIVIVGAGMAGIAAAFELKRLGISKIILIDKAGAGFEGPWITSARMRHLRSGKSLLGPAIQFPEYGFESYYKNKKGLDAWETLYKIPNGDWQDYLLWLRESLQLDVINDEAVEEVNEDLFIKTDKSVYPASKIILATGRGTPNLPDWTLHIPREKYIHTSEEYDFSRLKNKRIAVIGTGASGLDAAAAALEAGAAQVDLFSRGPKINNVNKALATTFTGYALGYYHLSDSDKLAFTAAHRSGLATPPFESVLRLKGYPNLHVHYNTTLPPTSHDFIILATGFKPTVPFLKNVDTWSNHMTDAQKREFPFALPYPYLGPHFELTNDIYCFNHSALLSHGNIAGDIPAIGIGANRLARGIAIDLFLKYKVFYYQRLIDYEEHEFEGGV